MPDCRFKSIWNSIMVFLLIYTATYMPYKTCFIDEEEQLQIIIDYIIDILFFMDIFVNFVSAEEEDRILIQN